MGLDNISGGGKNNSVLESLRLNNTPKIDPKTVPQAETEASSAISKYINVSSNIVISTKVNKGSVPASTPATKDFIPNVNTPLVVGDHVFSNVRKLSEGMDVEEAKKVTKGNKIDEIIFKTEDDNLYIAYGSKEDKGSLKLDQVKEGYVGKFGNQTAKIISIDNEVNTVKEGALSPLKSTWASVKESGTTGITKGISEMGATLVAMFVGKALIQNGITAVSTTEGTVAVVTGATNAIST
ncbi:MAG: hypothetical protein H7263_01185, partial [Candidatus Sericytochromatia bacterium]|nr:hypothetical protein [Candidatus Sericytochromatia bacterium]